MSEIHVSLKAEPIAHIGEFVVTNSMLGSMLVLATLFLLGVYVNSTLRKTGVPSRPQLIVELLYSFLEKIVKQAVGENRARKYLGLVITLFLFIVFGSWFGLLPGVMQLGFNEIVDKKEVFVPYFRAPTTDLNATIALAIIAFLTIQYSGFSALGFKKYMGKFFSVKHGPVHAFIGILELISEFVRLISFSVRLFGNIFAGEVLLVVVAALSGGAPVPTFIILMEFFVALLQAYIFVNLMSIFVSMAATEAEH